MLSAQSSSWSSSVRWSGGIHPVCEFERAIDTGVSVPIEGVLGNAESDVLLLITTENDV